MSVTRFKSGALLLVISLLVLGMAVPATACESEGRGSKGRFGCPKEPPNFDDTDKGDPDPRANPLTDEELWQKYCVDRYPAYEGYPSSGPFDNDPESLNDFRFHSFPIADFYAEFLNLDPTGEYIMVYAVCGGPMFDNHRDASGPWYGYGPDGANFARWIVAEVEPVPLEEIRDGEGLPAIEDEVAAREVIPGEMAPPADAGVVNTKTWLWVENNFDDTVYAEKERGNVTVWVEAVPTNTVFEVDDEEVARCEGPGTPYAGGPLSATTDCFHEGFEKASANGPLEGTVTIEWVFHWGMGDDYYGEFHSYDATTDLSWTVDEVFSTETG